MDCSLPDCSLPGSSVQEILQAKILEWVKSFLQKVFRTQGLNLGLPHCMQFLYCLSHWGASTLIILFISIVLNVKKLDLEGKVTFFISKNYVLLWKRHLSQETAYSKHLWNFWKLLLSLFFVFVFFLFQFQTVYYTLAKTMAKIEFYIRDTGRYTSNIL